MCTISRLKRRRHGRDVTLVTQMKWLFYTEARAPSESVMCKYFLFKFISSFMNFKLYIDYKSYLYTFDQILCNIHYFRIFHFTITL